MTAMARAPPCTRLVLAARSPPSGCSVDWSNEMASLHVGRDAAQGGHRGADRVDDADGVGARLLEHADVDAALAVDADDLVLIGGAVFDLGDVRDPNRGAARARRAAAGPCRTTTSLSGRAWGTGCWRRRCSRDRRRAGCRSARAGSTMRTALTRSMMPRPRARSASRLALTSISRVLPPPTVALATPGNRSSCGSIVL